MPSTLADLATVKAFLGLRNTKKDAQITALLPVAYASIEEYCGRIFAVTNYIEFYSGNSTRFLPLRQRPVLAINNVWEDFSGFYGANTGGFGTETLLTSGLDYCLDIDSPNPASSSRSGILVRIGTVWNEQGRVYFPGKLTADVGPSYGNIKVDYQAGYTTIPSDLQYATALLVSFLLRTVKLGQNVASEKIGEYTYRLPMSKKGAPAEIGTLQQILGRYREVSW